jgi:hypothetical protein
MPWRERLPMDERVQFMGDYQRELCTVTDTPTHGRADNLYTAVADDGGERGRNWTGHVRGNSIYTKVALRPALTAAVLGALSGLALTFAIEYSADRRNHPDFLSRS